MKRFLLLLVFLLGAIAIYAQTGEYRAGDGALDNRTTGDFNTVVGDSAGYELTSGSNNTFFGYQAGRGLVNNTVISNDNTFIGYQAGKNNDIGTDNVFIGAKTGLNNNATDNIFIGTEAGYNNTTGSDNVFIGEESGEANTTGRDNVFIGEDAGFNNTTASDNTFVGSTAGRSNTTGTGNTFVGGEGNSTATNYSDNTWGEYMTIIGGGGPGYDNTTGIGNTFFGSSAGEDNGVGNCNTFIGYGAGGNTEHADKNTFVGYGAGWDNNRTNSTTNANNNTYLGYLAGGTNREGQDNVGIGTYADYNNDNRSRTIFIGSYCDPDNNDVILMGYDARVSGQYGIGFGNLSDVLSTGAIGLGHLTQIGGGSEYSISIGYHSLMTDDHSVGIGNFSTINANFSVGIGSDITLDGQYAVALGASSVADTNSVALGYSANAGGNYSVALGTNAVSSQSNSFVVGGTTATDRMTLGIGTASPNLNASIDLSENNKGFLVNRLSETELTTLGGLISTTETGLMVYDSTNNRLKIWNGSDWSISGAQELGLSGNTLSITDGNTIDLSTYLDNTDSQELSFAGNTLSLSGGTNTVDFSLYLDNTDEQDLTLSGNTLSLTNDATTVDLSMYLDNTDTQLTESEVDAMVDNNGYLTSFTEVDGDATNEIQDLQLIGNDLTITNNGAATTIDLTPYLDNTDTQLTEAEVDAMVDNNGYLTSFTEVDGDVTNEIQDIALVGTDLSITSGSTIDLSGIDTNTQLTESEVDAMVGNNGYLTSFTEVDGDATNEIQDIALVGTDLSITSGSTIDLSGIDTNTQLTESEVDALVDNNGYLTSFTEVDGDITNEIQDLQLVGNDLMITNNGTATTIDLSPYLDDTDTHLTEAEVDALVDNNGYLTSFTEVDGDITNEIQDLQLVGNDLTITNNGAATTIDLSPYLDDTDTHLTEAEVDAMVDNNGYLTSFTEVDGDVTNEIQDLQLVGNDLTITNNGTATAIDLSPYLDDTDTDTHLTEAEVDAMVDNNGYLTSFTEADGDATNEIQDIALVGTDLSITSGSTVDLYSIIEPLQVAINDLTDRIDSLENVIADCCGSSGIVLSPAPENNAKLYQNVPNPWRESTSIGYFIPNNVQSARIEIRDNNGKILNSIPLSSYGEGHIIISSEAFIDGVYLYSLIVDNKLIDTKRFVSVQ